MSTIFINCASAQRLEHDDLVDAIQELRPEVPPQFVEHRRAHDGVLGLAALEIENPMASDVRGHDENRVLEVDRAALTVGQATVVEDLQKDVEDVRRGLLDLVEEHDGERTPPHGLGKLAAFFISDISGRCADQSSHRVLLAVLRHVDAHHRALVVEQVARERSRELGLADAGRAEEDERADRTIRIGKPERERMTASATAVTASS